MTHLEKSGFGIFINILHFCIRNYLKIFINLLNIFINKLKQGEKK